VKAASHPATVFLISPANLKGKRGQSLLNGRSDLARELRSPAGLPLEAAFSFVSSLYFRGKAAYAKTFGSAPPGLWPAHVMSAGGGLLRLDEHVTLERLRGWADVAIHEDNLHFTQPLQRHAAELLSAHDADARFVLLGSVASSKYARPLLEVFGERLLFPSEFLGRGDMSRGALLLQAVREGQELVYRSVIEQLHERRSIRSTS
jgi:hypothetical protein